MSAVDEMHGFRYFDDRDLTGFVDGTENPVGEEAVEATIVGDEDPDFAGGSYVLVQKYMHDLAKWEALTTEEQELIIGRTKLSDIELDDDDEAVERAQRADGDRRGRGGDRHPPPQHAVRRRASGESGTYFIGYARSPRVLEQMLENMFVGAPPGNYDRLLDFTHPVTGTLFFAPPAAFLEALD